MTVRLLVTGDIHIGRRPTRVPDADLAEHASAARMWRRIVDRAIDQQVDAVLLTGDIVEHKKHFYEATGPLEEGIIRLAKAKIQTFAVAGNHDFDVFPMILKQLKQPDTRQFHFLGAGGKWEEAYLEREGRRILRIVGWSYPTEHVTRHPLDDFPSYSAGELPTIALLHADVDASNSRFCPVRLSELQARRVSLWVLGHIHKPQHWPSESGTQILNPGCPQALAPDEPGPHGPWLIELDGARSIACRQLPMSVVRYEACDVDLSRAGTEDDFHARVNAAILNALETVTSDSQRPDLLSLRWNLKGPTALCGLIDSLSANLDRLSRTWAGVTARVDKCINRTWPDVDLDQLAQQNDLLGVLAKTLVVLERDEPDESIATLLSAAFARLEEVYRASAYGDLVGPDLPPSQETARRILLDQGWRLLEAIRSQAPDRREALG